MRTITITITIMNATNKFTSEYFRIRFAKHDAIIEEIIGERKTSSRRKRNYQETFEPHLNKCASTISSPVYS